MIDAEAVVAHLRETDARSGGRRQAWTAPWGQERRELDAIARAGGGERLIIERDAFANTWYVLPGDSEATVLVGSHSDCVPDGGWLDGILGVHAGLGVLAAVAPGPRPRRTLAVVDWADEEGTRFGRSLLGSSAATGALTARELDGLAADDGRPAREVVADHGFDASALGTRSARLAQVVAAVELHIEQGPVLEGENRVMSAVSGCLGVRRSRVTFQGTPGHAGALPMRVRRDPVRSAARFIVELFDHVEREEGLATVGRIRSEPAIVTAVPVRASLSLDLRHASPSTLRELEEHAGRLAQAGPCPVEIVTTYRQDPVRFDPELVRRATAAAGGGPPLVSGPLHDSAALAQAGIPTVMLFVSSTGGISHARAEDTPERHLTEAVTALHRLVTSMLGD